MTPELTVLTLVAVLAASLWVPYIIGVNVTHAPLPADSRPHDPGSLAPWVHRAFRAHLNLLEQALPFGLVVIVAHLAGVTNTLTVTACWEFAALRVVHAVWMIGGFPVLPVRPLIFVGGWIAILAIAVTVLLA
ncbi:MAPEG family protein [Roseivivax sp. CAU 1753]